LQWGIIDGPAKTITCRSRKTGKLLTIPMHEKLDGYLLEFAGQEQEGSAGSDGIEGGIVFRMWRCRRSRGFHLPIVFP
jgi:hypothetical protein